MKAPEKIYIHELSAMKLNTPIKDRIEYVRADAFIEKAWDWIEDNVLSSNQRDKSRLYFEQFKKYLEK